MSKARAENPKWIPVREPYYVQTGSMFDNPHGVPPAEVVRMIAENPAEVTAQTVFGKYVESSGLVFLGELIEMMIDRRWKRVVGNAWRDEHAAQQARLFREHRRGEWPSNFHTGVDLARQTDYTVLSTIDVGPVEHGEPARLVAWKRLNRVPWETIYLEIARARVLWGTNILVDSTGPTGDTVMDALENRLYCMKHDRCHLKGDGCPQRGAGDCRPDVDWVGIPVEGYTFGQVRKRELIEHLRNVLSIGYDFTTSGVPFGQLRVPPIVQLVEEELPFYSWDDRKLMTDCVMSLALAAWSGLEDPRGAVDTGSPYGE